MVGGRVVNVDRRTVARIAAPVAFLVAMTIAVLVVRSGLRDDTPAARAGGDAAAVGS